MNRKKLLKKVIIKYGKLDFKPIYKERQTLGIFGIMYQYPDEYEYFYDEQGNILKGVFLGKKFVRQINFYGHERIEKELFLLENREFVVFERREVWTNNESGKTVVRKIAENQSIKWFHLLGE